MRTPPFLYPFQLEANIILKPLKAADTEDFFAFVETNRTHLEQFDPFVAKFHSPKDVRKTLSNIQRRWREGRTLTCGIWDGLRLIGWCNGGLNHHTKTIEIGYGLDKAYVGRGIITRTVQTIITYAFSHLDIQQAWLSCWTGNTASIRIAESLGFTPQNPLLPANPAKGLRQPQQKYTLRRSSDRLPDGL